MSAFTVIWVSPCFGYPHTQIPKHVFHILMDWELQLKGLKVFELKIIYAKIEMVHCSLSIVDFFLRSVHCEMTAIDFRIFFAV